MTEPRQPQGLTDEGKANLVSKVRTALDRGVALPQVRQRMLDSGISPEQVDQVLDEAAGVARAPVTAGSAPSAPRLDRAGRRSRSAPRRTRPGPGRERSKPNPIGGILGMILVIVLLNVLSAVFDWGWYFY